MVTLVDQEGLLHAVAPVWLHKMHGRLTLGFVHVLCRFTEQLFYRCYYESTWITSHHMDFNNCAQLTSILVIYLVAGQV